MSAVFPWTSRELHRFGLGAGLKFLNTPISGSAQTDEQGALTLFCGGDKEEFQAAQRIA
jgi:3-hydroxyisobutyrate dehydrogenase-like beta-hydroxyacid dehydrogenase